MIDLNECLSKGLIRKYTPSKEQALASLNKAKTLLAEAEGDLQDKRYNSAMLVGYVSILNASRAVLFKDGYREKSHVCIVRYIEAKYKNKLPEGHIKLLDHYRETRHEIQYGTEQFAEEQGAREIVEFAKKYMKIIEGIIK